MLRVYRAWTIEPYGDDEKLLKAEKGTMTIIGEWEEIVPQIDRYEYKHAKEVKEDE